MDTSTVMRNISIVQDVLSGLDYAACAKKFNITVPTVSNSIRSVLRLLKEHTDIDLIESSHYSYLLEKKDEIKKYLTQPFPKTSITQSAKAYLLKKYGRYYARDPGKVAAEWADHCKHFNYFTARRELVSIQNWLASEGHMMGNILTDDMLGFAWEVLHEGLSAVQANKGPYSMTIKKVERTGWKTKLMVHAEITENGRQVKRRFAIDLLPD